MTYLFKNLSIIILILYSFSVYSANDFLSPAEKEMLKSYEKRQHKRTTSVSSDNSYNIRNCKDARKDKDDYQDMLRKGCRINECDYIKKQVQNSQTKIDEYCR